MLSVQYPHGMLACILLTTASLLGLALALKLPLRVDATVRIGLGVALGQLLLLWGPFGLAAGFDLGVRRAGVIASGLGCLALLLVLCLGQTRRRAGELWAQLTAADTRRSQIALACVSLPVFGLLFVLSCTHYLAPQSDGLHSAGVTWGDLPVHLALATRALYAPGLFAIEHPLFVHGPLAYPFLPDYSVAVLCALGLPLRWGFILGGLLPLAALCPLLFGVTQLWLGEKREPWVWAFGLGLFFFAGGLGFYFVVQALAAGEAPGLLLARMNATYIDPLVLKSATIGNLFIAARSAAYGMPLGAAALLLFGHASEARDGGRWLWLSGAALAGFLPLIHGHSFLVLALVLVFYSWAPLRRGQLQVLSGFAVLALLALPQLLWLVAQGAPSALRVELGMLRPADSVLSWLRDVALDLGVWLVLVPVAFVAAPARARRLALPLLLLAPLANLICFTPAQYDNVKLLAWFDLAAAPLVAALLVRLGAVAAGVLATGCALSGVLAVAHELTNDALVISYADVELADFVREHTSPDAVIATAASYHDPVAMFSGRRAVLAAPAMLGTHGIFVGERARELILFFRGGPQALEIQKRLGISAALVSSRERHDLPWLDEDFLRAHASRVFEHAAGRLYLLRAPDDSELVGLLHDGARQHQDQKQ